jgi:DNA-binding NarL/FixJ family response regulator
MAVKIVLVDDQPVPGLTLRHWLKKQRELDVVGEAVPGSPALALIQITEPDVVVLDVQTSPEAGLNMARMIRDHYPNVPIVAIGGAANGDLHAEAAEAGAWAYFSKTRPEELPTVIQTLLDGKGRRFLDLAKRVSDRVSQRPATDSFVALPGQTQARTSPEPPPPPPVVIAPRKPAKPAKPAPPPSPSLSDGVVFQKPRSATPAKRTAAVKREAPTVAKREATAGKARDAVAWVSPSLEPAPTPQPKPRRVRRKKAEILQEIDVRGPTGLPRRYGGHR